MFILRAVRFHQQMVRWSVCTLPLLVDMGRDDIVVVQVCSYELSLQNSIFLIVFG